MITVVFAFIGGLLGSMVGSYVFYSSGEDKYYEDYRYKNSGHQGTMD